MKKTFQVHVDIPKETHDPMATTQRAETCTKVPVTSDTVTSSDTTPVTAAQVPPECATRQAPIKHRPLMCKCQQAPEYWQMPTKYFPLSRYLQPLLDNLLLLPQYHQLPLNHPLFLTQYLKYQPTRYHHHLMQQQATTQIPATLTTLQATTARVPATQIIMPTAATNVPTPQVTSIQLPAKLVTEQPTATRVLSTPAPKQAVPATKRVTPQQTPSYHTRKKRKNNGPDFRKGFDIRR